MVVLIYHTKVNRIGNLNLHPAAINAENKANTQIDTHGVTELTGWAFIQYNITHSPWLATW